MTFKGDYALVLTQALAMKQSLDAQPQATKPADLIQCAIVVALLGIKDALVARNEMMQ